jgi:hypothetical protein
LRIGEQIVSLTIREKPITLMIKLTDSNYFLPEVYALYGDRVLSTGTTQPMLIRGVCKQTEIKSDYVVKFISSPRMSPTSSCNELVAALIAMELELDVAEPALIDISPEFVDTIRGKDGYKNASNSIGINFGCKYVTGFMEITSNQRLSPSQLRHAEQIFPFDIFISNSDRRIEKPNMLTDGEQILIFDHELAFGFIMDIIKNPKPWIITDSEISWIKTHYFYPVLKKNEHNFDSFVDKFTILSDSFWEKLYSTVPSNWAGAHFGKIKNNLCLLIENKEYFKEELKRIMS